MNAGDGATNRTILFVNWAHALDHFVLLIFPVAVIAIAAELKRDYGDLIWLSTGAFVAFGLFALPIGWFADRFGRRALLTAFFFGSACTAAVLWVGYLGGERRLADGDGAHAGYGRNLRAGRGQRRHDRPLCS